MSDYIDHMKELKKKWGLEDLYFFKYYFDGRYVNATSFNKYPTIESDKYKLDLLPIIKTSTLEEIASPDFPSQFYIYLIEAGQFYHSMEELRKDALILKISRIQ